MAAEDWQPEDPPKDRTWWDTAKGAASYADETIGDAIRAGTNAITFGNMDRFVGYMNSGGKPTFQSMITGEGGPKTYDEAVNEQVKLSEKARERSPYASIVGDVAGSVAIPGLGAGALAARGGSTALARAGAYGLTGGVTGALQGAGNTYSGEASDYAKNAGLGAILGIPLGAAGGAAFGARPNVTRAVAPTEAELHGSGDAAYRQLAASRAPYEPSAFRAHADDLEADLLRDRFHWRDSPATWRAFDEMRGGGVPGQINTGQNAIIDPASIEFVRKGLNRIPQTEATATDRESARIVKRGLDDFIINPPPGAVLPGGEREARIAARAAQRARNNWSAYERTQDVNEIINNARNSAGATHSGLNLENETRKGVRTFIKQKGGESPASKAGFNPAEIDDLTRFARGNFGTNLLRGASATLGGGGGAAGPVAAVAFGSGGGALGKYISDDPYVGGAIGATAPILGWGLRVAGNRRADRSINELSANIARRSPLYDERVRLAPTGPGPGSRPATAKAMRDAVTLELLKQDPLRITVNPRRRDETTSDWE
jgi:hypothetical protein